MLHRKEQWDIPCGKPLLVCHMLTPNSSTRLFCIGKRGEDGVAYWKEAWQKEKSSHLLTIADSKTAENNLRVKLEEALERVEKWKTWHDAASEDAKKWRIDAQKFCGALQQIADPLNVAPQHKHPAAHLRGIAREALADRP